jgi:hypothetical protein
MLSGITPTSLLSQAAAEAGYSFEHLISRLIERGLEDTGIGIGIDIPSSCESTHGEQLGTRSRLLAL